MTAVDHRRATADRNRSAILDAVERLLSDSNPLSMVAVAAEAGVSRPTLYAHFRTLPELVEAAVQRSVDESMAAIEAANPQEGPADEALMRMVEASWTILGGYQPLARGAAEFLSAEELHRSHAPLMALTTGVIERGQREGAFRKDRPADWLVTAYYSLIHGAEGAARAPGATRERVLELLKATVGDVVRSR